MNVINTAFGHWPIGIYYFILPETSLKKLYAWRAINLLKKYFLYVFIILDSE